MVNWGKKHISKDHLSASLSFPFIYPPYKINGEYYIEGAAIDTLNLKHLFNEHAQIDTTIVFDVLGSNKIIHPPKNLYEAWVQSIIIPLTEIARDDLRLFELIHNKNSEGVEKTKILRVPFENFIDRDHRIYQMDWSYSNLSYEFDAGYQAGKYMCKFHRVELGLS